MSSNISEFVAASKGCIRVHVKHELPGTNREGSEKLEFVLLFSFLRAASF
jgi:hypothetical protein